MPATTNSRLLVTGASGNLGRLVVRHLLHTLNIEPSRIVAGSRNPDKLKEFADLGVQTRRIDFNDETSIKAAAQGVDRVLMISGDDIFGRLEGHKTAVRAFEAAGVKHILYTSLQEADDSVALVAEDHRETERAIRESKIPGHTFLRNGLYFEVALGNISGASKSGQWFSAAKDGKLAAIARDDVARAAAYALASDSTENKVYEITGSEAFTIDEVVAQISKTIEKPIQVVQVSAEDLAKGIAAATGLPEGLATVYASFDTNTAQGFCATATNHYKQLTGVEPQTHEAWLAANKTLLASL